MLKRVVLIGQAPPKTQSVEPFGRTRLYAWLRSVGIEKHAALEQFAFTALIDIFPGTRGHSHKPPTEEQIAIARPKLLAFLAKVHPDVIVPVGVLAIRECLCEKTLHLADAVGHVFIQDPFGSFGKLLPIIPLPHPSGASPWVYELPHQQLLDSALQLLACELRTM